MPGIQNSAAMKPDSLICLRVARQLSVRGGHGELASHIIEDSPERTAGAPEGTKFVDLSTVSEDGLEMALEHTIIESYELQLHEARQIESLLLPLEDRLADELPAGSCFQLAVGHGAVFDRDLDRDDVLRSVESWVRSAAPTLKDGSPSTAPAHFVSAGPPDIAVELTLYRWSTDTPARESRLQVIRSRADDVEVQFDRRVRRLERALDDKLVKFERYEASKSVLVLEDRDVATSNLHEVVSALKVAATGRMMCDTIVLAETGVGADSATIVFNDGEWLDVRRRSIRDPNLTPGSYVARPAVGPD